MLGNPRKKPDEEHKEPFVENKDQEASSTISTLRTLRDQNPDRILSGTSTTPSISPAVQSIIDKLNSNDEKFTELNLKKMKMTAYEKKCLFNALAANHTVIKADLDNTNFSYADAIHFCEAFKANTNTTLKELILNNNRIIASILEVILKTPLKLDKLIVSYNNVKDQGAKLVAEFATMPMIALHQNRISTVGVDYILNSGKKFAEVTYMGLKMGNNFGVYKPLEDKIASFDNASSTNTTSFILLNNS